MKRIKHLFSSSLVLISVLLTTACQKDEQPFSQTPAERTKQAITTALTTLQGSTNGWEMSIYPSPKKSYGGYTIFVLFGKDGSATIADEKQELAGDVTRSLYAIDNSNGPTLTFNTYNVSMHRYSEPNSSTFPDASLATGADGDYSFQIVSTSPEKVVLRGVRSGVYAELKPLQSSYWEAIVTNYQAATRDFFLPTAQLIVDGTTIPNVRMTTQRHLSFEYEGSKYNLPYRYTATGIELYEELSIKGITTKSLNNRGTAEQPILSDDSGKIQLKYQENLYVLLTNSVWHYDVKEASGRFAEAVSNMNKYLKSTAGGKVDANSIYFGNIDNALVLVATKFYYNTTRSQTATLQMVAEPISHNEVKIRYNHTASEAAPSWAGLLVKHRSSHILAAGFSNIGKVDGYYTDSNYEGRTFVLSAEPDTARPSWIKLVEKGNEGNSIKMQLLYSN